MKDNSLREKMQLLISEYVGKLADFAVLSDDILTCDEDGIKGIRALMTAVGGKIVHDEGI